MNTMIVTVSCQYGSGGHKIAERLAEALALPFYDESYFSSVGQGEGSSDVFGEYRTALGGRLYGLVTGTVNGIGMPDAAELPEGDWQFLRLTDSVKRLAEAGGCVIVADGCECILREHPGRIGICVSADYEDRLRRVAARDGLSEAEARRRLARMDKKQKSICAFYAGEQWDAPQRYAICVNSSFWGLDGSVVTILDAMGRRNK